MKLLTMSSLIFLMMVPIFLMHNMASGQWQPPDQTVHIVTDGFLMEGVNFVSVTLLDLRGLDGVRKITSRADLIDPTITNSTLKVSGVERNAPESFATTLYMEILRLQIRNSDIYNEGDLTITFLPPNAFIHLRNTYSKKDDAYRSISTQSGWDFNTTLMIEDTLAEHKFGVPVIRVFSPLDGGKHEFKDNCFLYVKNMEAVGATGIIDFVERTFPIKKQSALVFEDVQCKNFIDTLDTGVMKLIGFELTDHSAWIVNRLSHEHTKTATVMPFLLSKGIFVDETSVISLIDIDIANSFKASTAPTFELLGSIEGPGTILFSRWLIQATGLTNFQPVDNTNFWVSMRNTADKNKFMTNEELRAQFINVNENNAINWDGTDPKKPGTCVPIGSSIPGRATYALVNGKCTRTCNEGYDPPACRSPPSSQCKVPNCDLCYRITKVKCIVCAPYTETLNDDRLCKCPIDYCTVCPEERRCTQCYEGYNYSATQEECLPCSIAVKHCISCSKPSLCDQCDIGYNVSKDKKKCVSCNIPDCIHCSDNEVCDECIPLYTLMLPFSTDSHCISCNTPNCLLCSKPDFCHLCVPPFTFSTVSQECVDCDVDHCKLCNVANKCVICNEGYSVYEPDSSCIPCEVDGCDVCSEPGVCKQCKDGYSLLEGGDVCILCPVDGCETCSVAGVCKRCKDSYTLVHGKCIECPIEECKQCNMANICSICEGDLSVSLKGTSCVSCPIEDCLSCISENHCGLCSCGMVPTTNGSRCVTCSVPHCDYCDAPSDGDKCSQCADGYEVKGNSCTKAGIASWVILLILTACIIVIVAVIIAVICLYDRHQSKKLQDEKDASERRINRQRQSGHCRNRSEICILNLEDIEAAASGVRDAYSSLRSDSADKEASTKSASHVTNNNNNNKDNKKVNDDHDEDRVIMM